MKFKTYRIIDLIMLIILAFGLELLTTYLTNSFLGTIRPYPILGLLITLVAVSRWGLIGLVVVPFNAFGNYISGRFILRTVEFREMYNWIYFIFANISNLSASISLLFYNKKSQNEILKDSGSCIKLIISICIINYVANIITSLFLATVTSNIESSTFGTILYTQLFWNAVGYVVLFIGFLILRKQEVCFNVKEKLLANQKERIDESKYYNDIKRNN